MIGSLINEDMKVEGFLHAEDPLSTMLALNQIGSVIESVDGKFINIKKRNRPNLCFCILIKPIRTKSFYQESVYSYFTIIFIFKTKYIFTSF